MRSQCCQKMTDQVEFTCEQHPDVFDCPDALVFFSAKFDEYGLIIHDGGPSFVPIAFCPWCGSALPRSRRNQWFAELRALGFDDPTEQEIPEPYRTDSWHLNRLDH
ncbi:DUF6980 family protein [Hydrogenophaga sp.]|uniref:DUF6980 family protein n=1 Tax=Hydrogenophaga sp. TaxID=1904254 RepID=UPI003F72B661